MELELAPEVRAFNLLGISVYASDEEYKSAYKEALLQTHPDKRDQRQEDAAETERRTENFKKLIAVKEKVTDARNRIAHQRELMAKMCRDAEA